MSFPRTRLRAPRTRGFRGNLGNRSQAAQHECYNDFNFDSHSEFDDPTFDNKGNDIVVRGRARGRLWTNKNKHVATSPNDEKSSRPVNGVEGGINLHSTPRSSGVSDVSEPMQLGGDGFELSHPTIRSHDRGPDDTSRKYDEREILDISMRSYKHHVFCEVSETSIIGF